MSTVAAGRHTAPTASARGDAFAGTLLLAGLTVCRSRWFWLVWVLALWSIMPATITKYNDIMVPGSAAATAAALESNVTMRAMLGPPYDLLRPGPFVMWRVGTFVAAGAAMMAALGVIRATRAEEEVGRIELLRAGAIGRHAPLAAGVLVSLVGCALLGGLTAVSMVSQAAPATGGVVTGLGIGLVGAIWVGVGAIGAQLFESARSARSFALGILGAAYVVRAVADGSADDSPLRALQWASPLEWAALAKPYVGDRWWVLALAAALAGALIAIAFRLESIRDHGSGLRATRPGPAEAAPGLRDAASLGWRLHRSSIIGWSIGIALCAFAFGTLGRTIDQMLVDNPQVADMMRKMGGGADDLKADFSSAMLGILVTVLALFALQLISRLRREEEDGHAEVLLATATSRSSFVASHLVPALVVPTALLAATGALLALGAGTGDQVATLTGAGLALAPGIWVVVGLAVLVFGWAPRIGWLLYVVVGWSVFISWFGGLLGLPTAIQKLTPWGWLPRIPVDAMSWPGVIGTTLVAAALIALGLYGARRRDLPIG